MAALASSWEAKTTSPERVAFAFGQALAQVKNPTGGLVFLAGSLGNDLPAVASALAARPPSVPLVIAGGGAVLTERGEIEDQPAAAGIIWSGGRAELLPLLTDPDDDVGESLARLLEDRTGKTSPTVLLFLPPEGFGPSTLIPLQDLRGTRHVFGAGTVGKPGSAAVSVEGKITIGPVAMILRGVSSPVIRTAHSSRLLGPLRPITQSRGALLLEIDGEPALDSLTAHGERVGDRQLLFLVLANEAGPEEAETGRPPLLVRGIQGVDPDRRALVVSGEIREGMRIAFAVRDPRAARDDFEAMTRELERDIAGALPRFGVLIDCAGRGSNLYGTPDVDVKILKARFPGMPFAGLSSSFEIAPYFGKPAMQLYNGVVALFTSPS